MIANASKDANTSKNTTKVSTRKYRFPIKGNEIQQNQNWFSNIGQGWERGRAIGRARWRGNMTCNKNASSIEDHKLVEEEEERKQ